ncbi:MAG: isoprenylcysteine carboxylmethyltransferase family protein [Bryobacteraceae bacterium]|jgi:protein-S-isoprenylcysteine O-methyltransferase Ste14
MAAKTKMMLLGTLTALAQFALAVLGWGGWRPFFAHPALVALAAITVALMIVAPFTSGNVSSGETENRGNRWVLAAFSLIALVNAYAPAYTDRMGIWTLDGDTIRWVGIFLYAAGGALRLWPVFVLGSRFSGLVAIQPGHTLETHCIYEHIRNPSYLGLLVIMLGWGMAFRAGAGILLTALMLPPLLARIRAEERLLGAHFGAEYDAYRARTRRLIPGIY